MTQPEAPSAFGEIRADGSVRPAGPGASSPHGALLGSAHFSSAALLSVRYTGTTERLPKRTHSSQRKLAVSPRSFQSAQCSSRIFPAWASAPGIAFRSHSASATAGTGATPGAPFAMIATIARIERRYQYAPPAIRLERSFRHRHASLYYYKTGKGDPGCRYGRNLHP